jgi:hypothetical protein
VAARARTNTTVVDRRGQVGRPAAVRGGGSNLPTGIQKGPVTDGASFVLLSCTTADRASRLRPRGLSPGPGAARPRC